MTVADLVEKMLMAGNSQAFTPRQHDVVIEHRLVTGQTFTFEVRGVELRADGSAVVLVTDGQAVRGGKDL